MKRSDFEIMAPVGSREALHAAINAGADAVYFGVEGLNMRARSSANFTLADLRDIASICSAQGVKTYLTVNTEIYDGDIDTLHAIVDAAAESGISAIIAADIAAILYARSRGVEVHISTQANICNTEAVRFYAQWADTVVLARELNLDQVSAIHRAIMEEPITGPAGKPVAIEMFCHGALCMAVSGKCYMSLHEMNSSANRGACTQICRRAYTLTDAETGEQLTVDQKYIMSPKDLKTLGFVDRLAGAGVRVLKIEGRARGPEYVATAVRAYDEALRAVCDGTFDAALVARLDEELNKIFNRGYWNGYYLGQRLGEWSGKYGSSATRVKRYVARALRYFPRLGVGEFRMEAGELNVGDEVIVTGPTTGALTFTVGEMHRDPRKGEETTATVCSTVVRGDTFSMPVPEKVRASDRLYLWEPTDNK